MKFQRIGTVPSPALGSPLSALTRIVVLGSMLCVATLAYAVDEDLPPPDAGSPINDYSSTSTAVQMEDETLPSPSLGDDSLPEPSADRGQENSRNQVNRPPEDDDIFLPTPNVNENIYYAPVGSPAPRMAAEDVDWRVVTQNRPGFSLFAGLANKGYINNAVEGRITGPTVGLSIRALTLGKSFFVHAFGAYSWFNVGNVLSVSNVKDEQLQFGPIFEMGIGRNLSIYGSFLRRQSRVSADTLGVANVASRDLNDLENVGTKPEWQPGVGVHWDFYVVPHGSIGARFHVEPDIFTVTLSMAIEPKPRKKLSMNFEKAKD